MSSKKGKAARRKKVRRKQKQQAEQVQDMLKDVRARDEKIAAAGKKMSGGLAKAARSER